LKEKVKAIKSSTQQKSLGGETEKNLGQIPKKREGEKEQRKLLRRGEFGNDRHVSPKDNGLINNGKSNSG